MIKVNEIFHSIQGESTKSGLPCIFIRLTYCNLRCSYCDTEYAFHDGTDFTIDQIVDEIIKYSCNLIEITGGEPLVQKESLMLMSRLCDHGFEVMLETGGSLPINNVDKRVKIIMDLKCPSSNMAGKNLYENIKFLKSTDEIKFVIGTREDYEWSKKTIQEYKITEKCEVLFSPVFKVIEPEVLTGWILEDKLNVRFQLQLHKYVWKPETRGV